MYITHMKDKARFNQSQSINFYDKIPPPKFNEEETNKVPVKRGCMVAKNGRCFCDGSCEEIVGYRDKLPGEV